MRVAIVGGGVSGLVAARLLDREHEVTVFEANSRVGGHVNTVEARDETGEYRIDTGFIVYNERNYPLFSRLLKQLSVPTQTSNMSFSVRCDSTGLEYNGSTVRQLFAQRRNLIRLGHYVMIRDILRFNRAAPRAIANGAGQMSLREYLEVARYSCALKDHYLVPMGSALWSMPRRRVLDIPVGFFVRFFQNHGMLTIDDRPEWRVVQGGSTRYLEALIHPFRDRIRTSTPVHGIRRKPDGVRVNGESFDQVILSCHSDQALQALEDPTDAERVVLGSIPFQKNRVVLHTDTTVLPKRERAWGAWNYHIRRDPEAPATVTYNMNLLQGLRSQQVFCVSLNPGPIDATRVVYETSYYHPIITSETQKAQRNHRKISGVNRTHYCGAYWGFGFHEDGVRSALRVARAFGVGS